MAVGISAMRWFFGAILVALAVVAASVGWRLGKADQAPTPDAVTAPALLTQFRLPTLDGSQLGPPDFAGRAVLIEFWASWCGPCHVQARILAALHEELKKRPIEFLAVNVGEDSTTVRSFVEANPFAYPVLLDERGALVDGAQIFALPTVLIISPAGEVVYLEQGISARKSLLQAIDDALAG